METQNDVLLDVEQKEETVVINESSENVFTKKVEPINRFVYFLMELGQTLLGALMWVVNFVVSIFVSLGEFFITVGKGIYKGAIGIYKFFRRKCHQFKYNDVWGRLSFIFFGAGSFGHKQIINGILYLLAEVGYIILFVIFGIPCIAELKTLGDTPQTFIPDPEDPMFEIMLPGDNSVLVLVYGLLWVLSIVIFLYIWNRSINAGYNNYRIKNFKKFEKYCLDAKDFGAELNNLTVDAYYNGESLGSIKSAQKLLIEEYIASRDEEFLSDRERVQYTTYLLKNVATHAYAHLKTLTKEEKIVNKAQAKLDKYLNKRQADLEVRINNFEASIAQLVEKGETSDEEIENLRTKFEIKVEKHKNKTMIKSSNLENNVKKARHHMAEVSKRYSPYVEMQHTKNNDKYGKFNAYFKKVAKYDAEIKFYTNYRKYADLYERSLGGAEGQNQANAQRAIELEEELNAKLEATNIKFDAIVARRKELEAELAEVKANYKAQLKELDKNPDALAEDYEALQGQLVVDCTRINGALHDLPSPKLVKAMRKEEIKESKHAFKRDKKYLKTNFTDKTYAEQAVVDAMLVEERFEYKQAIYYRNVLLGNRNGFLTDEEVDATLHEIYEEKDAYMEAHQDKYDGVSKTFIEQAKSLMDEKFHISILLLPILGIALMCIIPLFISILVAFTNYSKGHEPPTQLFTWIGFDNFVRLFAPEADSIYKDLPQTLALTLSWTVTWAIAATFSNYILGIIVALLINKESIKLKKLWRTVFVLTIAIPQFISLLSIATLIKENGAIDVFWRTLTGASLGFAKNDHVALTKVIIILVNIWVGIPYTILSTTGILLNIPKDLYESAKVDGAGTVKQFTKITMPYILFVTGPYLITSFVGNINNFNVIYFLTQGTPKIIGNGLSVGQTDLMITFLYSLITNNANPQYGIASTVGIVIFIICAFVSIVMYNKTGAIKEEDQFQ